MKAAVYQEFRAPMAVLDVDDPVPPADGVVLEVRATGVCRSDWHGWMGHDPGIRTPHVPGHEMAGLVAAVGRNVRSFSVGERVTVPFVCACGECRQCRKGDQQVCDRQSQPGFTRWGSFAEYVAIDYADHNLVRLPDSIDFTQAASLGCRFATAWRAIVAQGRIRPGEWLAVHGCGGVGLAAVMIARAFDAQVLAVDVSTEALLRARKCGAAAVIDAARTDDVAAAIRDWTNGGADVSIDALGSAATFDNSVRCLAKRGRHVQVGLMTGSDSLRPVPLDALVANELELLGSHGMQARLYPQILECLEAGKIDLRMIGGRQMTLGEAATMLADEALVLPTGVSVVDRFYA